MYLDVADQITYKFTDLQAFRTIAELPVTDCQFTLTVNGAGPGKATLNVEDPNVRQADWIDATATNLTATWVDIDGQLIYGGINGAQTWQASKQQTQIQFNGFYQYLSQRLQAQDYTAYVDPAGYQWYAGAPTTSIAYYLMLQAMAVKYSIPVNILPASDTPPSTAWIPFSAPLSQQQTLASIIQNLTGLGYGIGVDVADAPVYTAGVPTPQLGVYWPRAGRVAGSTGLTVNLADAIDIQWESDGTQQATALIEQLASGSVASEQAWTPAMATYNYPLLEKSVAHTSMSSVAFASTVMSAFAANDLAQYAFPTFAPVVTLPLLNRPNGLDIRDVQIGDDVLVVAPVEQLPFSIAPRFPHGFSAWLRAVKAEVNIVTEGVSTVDWTFNLPPMSVPQLPPV